MSVGTLEATKERPPYMKFERRAVKDAQKSLEAGHAVMVDQDYAIVSASGSRDCVNLKIERFFEYERQNVHKGKTPPEWLERWEKGYELWKKGEEVPVDGTAIKGWPALSPAEQQNVIACKILTVEDLAQANDEGLRRLGMGGRDLMNKAKAWLDSAKDTGKIALQNAALEKENEQLKITVSSLEEKLEKLVQKVDSMDRHEDVVTYEELNLTPEDVAEYSLSAQYEQKFGKPPHHRMKPETIRQKLEE